MHVTLAACSVQGYVQFYAIRELAHPSSYGHWPQRHQESLALHQ